MANLMSADPVARYRALPEAEGRVLILIDAFSGTTANPKSLEGRLKLAKLDFLARYPKYLTRVLRQRRAPERAIASIAAEDNPLADRMIRYRYGPWDPASFAVLGSLIGRGLVQPVPFAHGIAYRTTPAGREVVTGLAGDEVWEPVQRRAKVMKQHLDLSGSTLKNLVYDSIPEMTNARWHEVLE